MKRLPAALLALALVAGACASAQTAPPPDLPTPSVGLASTGMEDVVERYSTDRSALRRFYGIDVSPTRLDRLDRFDDEWTAHLATLDFDRFDRGAQIDYLLLRNELEHDGLQRDNERERLAELAVLLPFAGTIVALEETRWSVTAVDPEQAARTLDALADEIEATHERVKQGRKKKDDGEEANEKEEEEEEGEEEEPPLEVSVVDANWLAGRVRGLRSTLSEWRRHYEAYVPGFAWWTKEPADAVDEALEKYAELLREEIAGQKGEDDDPLIGDPIGRKALLVDLAYEMIPYSPEELVAIGEEQFTWCEAEMLRASNELGFGDDWKAALEHVKGLHVPPGQQDALVASQAREAIAFLDEHDLVTIPALCRETWRVRMLSKESQRLFPFANYGGQRVNVAYPTADMDHETKLMALRGNNEHFTRAVTPHELIPGHHLQGFMAQRFNTHRRTFSTPFYGEGWALYWEMLEWDQGWAKTPENRIGMLFWRMHRCARIIVSLGFHLEQMTPDEMIDFLVDRVGHERDGATGEVRRYIGGGYGPLYQCAYMIGGLQLRALHEELVGGGSMTNRAFHDAVLQQNSMPIEMIRAALTDAPLTSDHEPSWRFAGDVPPVERR
ncbi:MAG: DUF885 family protein [Planctomycetota bacterium]|nr:DUF885 family protein [Planctomycetota bacterium]